MALVTRYINTASTPGGDGTTSGIIGPNRAYASAAEWEAAEQTDLVADGDTHLVIASGAQDDARLIIAGWTTGPNNFITFTTTDDRHSGIFDETKYFMDIGIEGNPIFEIQEEYVRVEGIQFRRASLPSSGLDRECIFIPAVVAAGDIRVEQSIFKSIASDIAGDVTGITISDSSPNYSIKNNVFYDFNGTSDYAVGGGATSPSANIYNNTIINCTTGVESRASMTLRNNIFQDNTDDMSGTMSSANDYNLTDKATIPGDNSVTGSTLTFTDKANDDFSLTASDTGAIGTGIGPTADNEVPTVDIVDTARSGATTDIGAFLGSALPPAGITVDETTSNTESSSLSPAVLLAAPVIVSESLSGADSSSLNPIISLTASVLVNESLTNTDSGSLNPTISLTVPVIVSEQLSGTNSGSLNPTVIIAGPVTVNESISSSESSVLDPVISLTANVVVTEEISNTDSQSNDPTVILSTPIVVSEEISNTDSASLNTDISLTTNVIVFEQISSTNSQPNDPEITLGFPITVNESTSNTDSISQEPTITLTGAVIVTETTSNTGSNSRNPTITVGQAVIIENINISYKTNDIMLNYKANDITINYRTN